MRSISAPALALLWLGLAPAPPAAAGSSGGVVAVTLNLWHDQQDWPARMRVVLDGLRALGPDVVFLQEVIEKPGVPNQARALADSLGGVSVFVSADSLGATKRYGNAILTRHRVVATDETRLAPLDDYRVAAHVRLEVRGRRVDAYVTHLHHTAEGGSIRATQVRDLLAFVERTRGRGALLLGGDFNAAPDAPELAPVRERFVDTWAAVHPEKAGVLVSTLNPAMGHAPRRIDYLFAGREGLRPVASEVFLDVPGPGGAWGSDHFGVWTRLRWAH